MAIDLLKICGDHLITPRGIIHIGAHEGQELDEYLAMRLAPILLIEPNPQVFERLTARSQKLPEAMAVRCAVADFDGMTTLNVTNFDQSSSLLHLKRHRELYPKIEETHQVSVPCRRLDSLLDELKLAGSSFNLLHIDIQGAEVLALRGAIKTLQYIQALRIEVNVVEMYEGCPLLADVDAFLANYGFKRVRAEIYHGAWGDAAYVAHSAFVDSAACP